MSTHQGRVKDYLEYGDYEKRPLAYLRKHEPDYRDACFLTNKWPKTFVLVPHMAHSRQYDSGGPLTESNHRVWKESFKDTENKTWWDLGDNGILSRISIATSEEKEAIDSLDGYLILDESDMSELEQEIQDENWKDYGLKDTKEELLGRADPDDEEAITAFFEHMPDKVFSNAYWEQISNGDHSPEQDGGGYGTIFPRAFEDWDGSMSELAKWLDLSDVVVRVRLSDSAFGDWKPTKSGQKERKLRITKKQLEDTTGEFFTASQINKLMRNEEVQIKFGEASPCESLYVECEYPWGSEHDEPEEEAS